MGPPIKKPRLWVGKDVFSSALCYCTAELLSLRRCSSSVVHPLSVNPVFSERVEQINAKFGGKEPFYHIFRMFLFVCLFVCFVFVCFSKFCIYLFFLFSFSLTCDHMGEKISNGILSENAQLIYSPKFMHTPSKDIIVFVLRKCVYQSCIKNCEISNFGFWGIFIFRCCSFFGGGDA